MAHLAVAAAAVTFASFLLLYAGSAQASDIAVVINRTAATLQQANQSAYLIFYPNLTQAYADYYTAVNFSKNASDYGRAYLLLNRSAASAISEEERLQSYAWYSLFALAAAGIGVGAVLYRMMTEK